MLVLCFFLSALLIGQSLDGPEQLVQVHRVDGVIGVTVPVIQQEEPMALQRFRITGGLAEKTLW